MRSGAVLFYKRLVSLGGAEVLLAQHYAHLKAQGKMPVVVCFEYQAIERIQIDDADLVIIPDGPTLYRIFKLVRVLLKQSAGSLFFCHSGYIEFGLAASFAQLSYGVFLHQPTTMSFNETDKFSVWYWSRYKSFSKRDEMFYRLCLQRYNMALMKKIYINVRALISQSILRNAAALFVLSDYAVREKKEIFGLKAIFLAGGISSERVDALLSKPSIRGIKSEAKIILASISRLDRNKRIDILIRAVSVLCGRGLNVELKVAGRGPALKELESLVRGLELSDRVQFIGHVPEANIGVFYNQMDLFVTIDWADYRITTYEALAENRKVIVSSDTDSDQNLLNSGYLFSSYPNPTELANTIEKALRTKPLWDRKRLSEYLNNYAWPTYFDNISKALRSENA